MTDHRDEPLSDARLTRISSAGGFKTGRANRTCKAGTTHARLGGRGRKEGGVGSPPKVWTPSPSGARTLKFPSGSRAARQRGARGQSRLQEPMTTIIPVETSLHAGPRHVDPWGHVLRWAEQRTVSRIGGWSL